MSKPNEVAAALVTAITAFQAEVDSLPVVVELKYHDPTKLPADTVLVTVYPLTKRKERKGQQTKEITITLYAAIQCVVKPSDTARTAALIDYVEALDSHLDSLRLADTSTVIVDDEQFLWLPEWLHKQNKFLALVERRHRWGQSHE